jgi:hypothetical protein
MACLVFAQPLKQEFVSRKGVVTALPPRYVMVMFRAQGLDALALEPACDEPQ